MVHYGEQEDELATQLALHQLQQKDVELASLTEKCVSFWGLYVFTVFCEMVVTPIAFPYLSHLFIGSAANSANQA